MSESSSSAEVEETAGNCFQHPVSTAVSAVAVIPHLGETSGD